MSKFSIKKSIAAVLVSALMAGSIPTQSMACDYNCSARMAEHGEQMRCINNGGRYLGGARCDYSDANQSEGAGSSGGGAVVGLIALGVLAYLFNNSSSKSKTEKKPSQKQALK